MTTKQERTMQLVRAAQSGDEQACTALYQEYWNKVLRICGRFDFNGAEDLAQITMMQVFRKLGQFRGEALFSTWLHRLAVNTCLMTKRRKQLPMAETENEEGESWLENIPEGRDVENQVITKVDLERTLPELARGYAEVLLAHDYLGMQHQEIARMKGGSIGCSKSQLLRARGKMRACLTKKRGNAMETEICGVCKAAGFMDKIAHFRSYLDGKTGKRVKAKCYYHHFDQAPPWMREQSTKKGNRWGATLERVEKLENGQNVEVDLPPDANINALRSILYGAKATSLSRWSVEKVTETRARVTRTGDFPGIAKSESEDRLPKPTPAPRAVNPMARLTPLTRQEVEKVDISQIQVMTKEEYVGKYGTIKKNTVLSETQILWKKLQELSFEDVLIVPCPEGMDAQKYRAKLSNSVQRLVRMNKPAYKCTLGANVSKNWVVLLKQKLETMAATV